MATWTSLNSQSFRFIDHTSLDHFADKPYTALTSFAIDDALTLSVSERLSLPTVRLWAHDPTVVLGIADGRLPYLDDGITLLKQKGYDTVIRNSGGLAVALDLGVLNMSLILPNGKKTSIDAFYDMMVQFIQHVFRDLTTDIEAYEIEGSYCPGKYDLSIGGIKFAGISQRRIKDGAAIQLYLDIEGNALARAQLIQTFYAITTRGEKTQTVYPTIDPRSMGSLSDLLHTPLTVQGVMDRIKQTLTQLTADVVTHDFSDQEYTDFQTRYTYMLKRNENI